MSLPRALPLSPTTCKQGGVFTARVGFAAPRGMDFSGVVGPTRTVWAIEGESCLLPCDLTSSQAGGRALLVLWYKEGITSTLYSYDVRGVPAKHYSNPQHFDTRATFDTASLIVKRVRTEDAGVYSCRVHFNTGPSLTYTTNLTVIVPPRRLAIYDDLGVLVGRRVGPLREGDTLRLTCRARGGSPPPTVTWWEAATPLDLNMEVQDIQEVNNLLVVPKLTRNDLHRTFVCQASNSNLTAPLLSTVTLDMNFSPLWIHLLSSRDPMSAGWPYAVVCNSAGSRPPAIVTWQLGNATLTSHTEKVSDDGNVTTSELRWTPSVQDVGKVLSCQARSPAVPYPILKDEWRLNIYYVPVVSLAAGRTIDMGDIEEDDDVYFECSVKANPRTYKMVWLHESEELRHNPSRGVLISNQTLVLQHVTRASSGNYYCVASNIQGDGHSNPLRLKVKYAPLCTNTHPVYHGAARYEQVNIPCQVEAYPEPHAFKWTFNNSGESIDISEEHVLVEGARSTVSYTANTELDYGTLLCWGVNSVGQQRKPCVFHVFPAGHPDPVHNCSMFNLSMSKVNVRCVAGFDGGLPQEFLLQLRYHGQKRVLANVTSKVPRFSVTGIPPGRVLVGAVWAYNNKGRGEPATLRLFTLKDQAEKRTAAVKPSPPSDPPPGPLAVQPLVAVVSGAVGGVVVVILVVLVTVRLCHGRLGRRDPRRQAAADAAVPSATPSPPTGKDSAAWVVGGVRTISCPSLAAPYTPIPGTPRPSPEQVYQYGYGAKVESCADLALGGSVPHLLPRPHKQQEEEQNVIPHAPFPQHHSGSDSSRGRGIDRHDPARRSLPSVRLEAPPEDRKTTLLFTPRHESSV
ncbi:nephrin-like isoform X2 [Scylla paramamosain]|uniref:nephrin-like isoform X2 n=1 Tax=Scylla paramamosain TaxID=85552 RepID=UPI0030827139